MTGAGKSAELEIWRAIRRAREGAEKNAEKNGRGAWGARDMTGVGKLGGSKQRGGDMTGARKTHGYSCRSIRICVETLRFVSKAPRNAGFSNEMRNLGAILAFSDRIRAVQNVFCKNNGIVCFKMTETRSFFAIARRCKNKVSGAALKNGGFLKGAALRLLV